MKRFFCLMLLVTAAGAAVASCSGKVINPVTDVCWSCLFPIRAAGVTLKSSSLSTPATDATPLCTCGAGLSLRAGINLSFFEPLRTAEIVREPYCFPSLGGISINPGVRAPAHGRSARDVNAGDEHHRGTAFYQLHWYHTPWLFVLEMLLDSSCVEEAPWDLAYLTELDPLWDDPTASFVLAVLLILLLLLVLQEKQYILVDQNVLLLLLPLLVIFVKSFVVGELPLFLLQLIDPY